MAKKIHQFIGVQANQNILTPNEEIKYLPVIKLGIQGPAGTRFRLNGSNSSWITIGKYGIYELDLTNLGGFINSLEFENANQNIVVDIVYEGGSSV